MKTSPLQLEWIAYPKASYEQTRLEDSDVAAFLETSVQARVRYYMDGKHLAMLSIQSKPQDAAPYQFELDAMASFSFDLELAKQAYGPGTKLPFTVAANISRIVYASARDFLSSMLSRAPRGNAIIQSIIIEPGDVSISSDEEASLAMYRLFGIEAESIAESKDPPSGPTKSALKKNRKGQDSTGQ